VALAHSPDLPATLYSSTDKLFGPTDRDELMAEALALKAQADGGGSKVQIFTGLGGGLLRYNRVEGLAIAARAEKSLGSATQDGTTTSRPNRRAPRPSRHCVVQSTVSRGRRSAAAGSPAASPSSAIRASAAPSSGANVTSVPSSRSSTA
jgi:hypothetical protein